MLTRPLYTYKSNCSFHSGLVRGTGLTTKKLLTPPRMRLIRESITFTSRVLHATQEVAQSWLHETVAQSGRMKAVASTRLHKGLHERGCTKLVARMVPVA